MENNKFHERFDIEVNSDESRVKFVHRTYNLMFQKFLTRRHPNFVNNLYQDVAAAIGIQYVGNNYYTYVENDFYKCLKTIEAVYKRFTDNELLEQVENIISDLFELTEVNIGVAWKNGYFIKTGAEELDEKLVNDSLNWIDINSYETVRTPFEKSLRHLLESEKDSTKLSDVITDSYEAIEALAKIINDNDNDLSANSELFIKNVKASIEYKKILKDYIDYANKFRHAIKEGKKKPKIRLSEAESFVYLTGIFIRLASYN